MPANTFFDAIVIGVGTMGSSTCYHLAKKGAKVLGIEQFDIPHELGSHTGQNRIIRKAYFEHPDYVPLLDRAYELWNELEKSTGNQVYYRTGLVYMGKPDSDMIRGVRLSASLYKVPLENISAASAAKRFAQFKIPENFEVLFEPDAGFITPEKAISLYREQAEKNGAIIHTREKLIEWKKDGNTIIVVTEKAIYQCRKLVITAGAWAGKIIPGFASKIKVTRQFIAWLKPPNEKRFGLDEFPAWMIADETKPGCYYGFPYLKSSRFGGPEGLKMARHYPGIITDPDEVNRQTIPQDLEDIEFLTGRYFAETVGPLISSRTCLYANSPDENFIIDKLPRYEDQVVVACGFSGHGFKFLPVVGEILSDLVMEGSTRHSISFLNAARLDMVG